MSGFESTLYSNLNLNGQQRGEDESKFNVYCARKTLPIDIAAPFKLSGVLLLHEFGPGQHGFQAQ